MKEIGAWCSGVALYFIGGFDLVLEALLVLMVIDYALGLTLAGVFKGSRKSDSGGLNSWVGWMGIAKKVTNLLFVIVAVELQKATGVPGIREGVIIALTLNELISIIENAGLMGMAIPEPLMKMIDILKNRGETSERD
jgi:toxin secretion/phage lysis holin